MDKHLGQDTRQAEGRTTSEGDPGRSPTDESELIEEFDNATIREEVHLLMSAAQCLAVRMAMQPLGRAKVRGYVDFLLGNKPRNYPQLTNFLEWYGLRYLKNPIISFIKANLDPETVKFCIELGPGTGWLINSMDRMFEKRWAVDKRSTLYCQKAGVQFVQQDLEENPQIWSTNHALILANHFLHCVTNPETIISKSSGAYWLVVEPFYENDDFPYWIDQMRFFGATPIPIREIYGMFERQRFTLMDEEEVHGQWMALFKPTL